MPNGSLSLPIRLYLLSLDPTTARPTIRHIAELVRVGALTELAQRGFLIDRGGIAELLPDSRTGDPVLDGVIDLVAEFSPRPWALWVEMGAELTLDAVVDELVLSGYLRPRPRGAFAFLRPQRYDLDRPELIGELRMEAREVLRGPVPAPEVAEQDAALIVLAAAGMLQSVVTPQERKTYRDRILALRERGGRAAPLLALFNPSGI